LYYKDGEIISSYSGVQNDISSSLMMID
jgi:hypothetical protein